MESRIVVKKCVGRLYAQVAYEPRYIFSVEKSKIFSLYKRTDYTINLFLNTIPFHRPIYLLLFKELQMLKEHLNNFLKKQ